MNCPACNHANPADARFCQQCGTRLALVDQALATAESLGMTRLSEQALALKVRVQGILKA